jgi:peptide/nickel transport system substrate-binding protein
MLAVAIIVVLLVVSIVAVYFVTLPSTKPPEKTVVTYASLSEMITLDPSTEFSNSILVLSIMYEPLLWYDPLKGQKIPALATSWESKENATIWTFHLREGVTFHDGTPFNATALKYSINRTITLGQGAAFIWAPVHEINIIDEYTVEFRLSYSAPLDMIAAAGYAAWIFSPNTPNTPEWFNEGHDCGSGAYKIVKWNPETEVILEKYKDWWGWKEPAYPMASAKAPDMFVVKIVKDAVTQETLVKAGDIDIAEYVPLEDIDALEADPNLQVATKPSFQNLLILLNTRKAPLNETLVRMAIAHAIAYDDIVEVARSGVARVASGPVPHGMPGHFEDLKYGHNLTRSRELLTEAGYPDGGFKLVLTYTAGDIYEKKSSEVMKTNLKQLGIELEIRAMSWEEQWSLAQSGWENPDAAQDILMFYWWPTYITPYDFLYNLFHNEENTLYNLCYYSNSEFEAVADQANQVEGIDYDEALELYHQAQKILYEEVPGIALWDMVDVRVAVKRVGNLENAINPAYPTVIFAQALSVEK